MPISPQQEQDYQRLKALENLLTQDPSNALELERLVKKADPKARTPSLDRYEAVESVVDKRVKDVTAEVEALRKKLIEKEADELNERQITRLKRAPFNLSPGDIDEVKKLVAEKAKDGELISMETMARFYIAQRSPVGPVNGVRTPFSSRGNRPKDDWRKEIKKPDSRFFKDFKNYYQEQVDQAWKESEELINNQE